MKFFILDKVRGDSMQRIYKKIGVVSCVVILLMFSIYTVNAVKANDDVSNISDDTENLEQIAVEHWKWKNSEHLTKGQGESWKLVIDTTEQEKGFEHQRILNNLPKQIEVNNNEESVDVTWDLSAIPSETPTGKYTAIAHIENPSYRLTESAEELEIDVQIQKPEQLSLQDHIVHGIDASNTKINLFDYWITGESDPDNIGNPEYRKLGINALEKGNITLRHALLFSYGLGTSFGWANIPDGTSTPKQGMVERILPMDGYPKTTAKCLDGDVDLNDSTMMPINVNLKYLFDPDDMNVSSGGKRTYEDVKGLLQVDEDGYYSYNSDENFAEFNKQTKKFTLYDTPAMKDNSSLAGGQFFPFNTASQMFTENGGKLSSRITSEVDPALNHFFGLTMTTAFKQEDGGTNKGKPVTYRFMGDDDVWVFIDGVLVGDVGGMHAATNLDINFQTGDVRVYGTYGTNFESRTTIKQAFEAAGKTTASGFRGNTFADGTRHTLKFFYLERGHAQANLRLRYNLIPGDIQNKVIKVNSEGDFVEGADLRLYNANADYEVSEVIFGGTTDEKGEIGNAYTLDDLRDMGTYFVLRETNAPQGYRKAKELQLKIETHGDKSVLKVNNQCNSGAVLRHQLLPALNLKAIKMADGNSFQNYVDSEYNTLKIGEIFAVPMYKMDGKWRPIYGNDIDGWKIGESDSLNEIKKAVTKNPFRLVEAGEDGMSSAQIPLPGDIMKYDFIIGADKAEYKINYYYTISSITNLFESGTYLLDVGEALSDKLGMKYYVTDPKDSVYIQKLNTAKQPMNGAEFALFKETDITIQEDGKYQIHEDAVPLQTVMTRDLTEEADGLNRKGAAKFNVTEGVYYIIETKAVQGYKRNDTPVKVVVNRDGVFADAGKKENGVFVEKGIDRLYTTMTQFADPDGTDITLRDIKAQLEISDTMQNASWNSKAPVSHFTYNADKGYVLTAGTSFMQTDTGWSRLYIQQCNDHDTENDSKRKQSIGNVNLQGSFQEYTVVQMINQKESSLTVQKQVKEATANDDFTFKIELKDDKGQPLAMEYKAEHYNANGEVTNTLMIKHNSQFSLKDNEKLVLPEIDSGIHIKISESVSELYTTSVKFNQEEFLEKSYIEAKIMKGNNTVLFINKENSKCSFSFLKTDKEQNPLQGAGFVIYELNCLDLTHSHENDTLKFDKNGDPLDVPSCWSRHAQIISTDTGIVEIDDLLMAKEYRLIEYAAPKGYLLPEGQWRLKYDDETKKFIVSGIIGPVTGTPAFEYINTPEAAYRLMNYLPNQLPATGFSGTGIYLVIGMALIITGMGVFQYKARKGGEK